MRARTALLALATLVASTLTGCGDDAPQRVLLVGDSVLGQTAPALNRQLEEVDVRSEAVSGSGLLSPWFVDWPAELDRLLDRFDADAVVFLFVGNYRINTGEAFETADGHRIEDRRDPAFARAWQAQARRLTERAQEDADVVWVLPPPMQDEGDQAVVEALREGYEEVADETGAATVDANDALATDDGAFLGADGGTPLRSPDGVHLAPEGARRLAEVIADELEPSFF